MKQDDIFGDEPQPHYIVMGPQEAKFWQELRTPIIKMSLDEMVGLPDLPHYKCGFSNGIWYHHVDCSEQTKGGDMIKEEYGTKQKQSGMEFSYLLCKACGSPGEHAKCIRERDKNKFYAQAYGNIMTIERGDMTDEPKQANGTTLKYSSSGSGKTRFDIPDYMREWMDKKVDKAARQCALDIEAALMENKGMTIICQPAEPCGKPDCETCHIDTTDECSSCTGTVDAHSTGCPRDHEFVPQLSAPKWCCFCHDVKKAHIDTSPRAVVWRCEHGQCGRTDCINCGDNTSSRDADDISMPSNDIGMIPPYSTPLAASQTTAPPLEIIGGRVFWYCSTCDRDWSHDVGDGNFIKGSKSPKDIGVSPNKNHRECFECEKSTEKLLVLDPPIETNVPSQKRTPIAVYFKDAAFGDEKKAIFVRNGEQGNYHLRWPGATTTFQLSDVWDAGLREYRIVYEEEA